MRKLARSTWWIAALAAAACGSTPQEPTQPGDYYALPADQVLTDVTFRPTTAGILTALLHADTVYVTQDSSRYDLVGVDLKMFNDAGKLTGTLTSKTGEYSTLTQAMVARGHVILITLEEDRRIETEELHYDPSTRQVWSDVPTVMLTPDGPMRGTSFRADDGFRNVTISDYKGVVPGRMRMEF